MKTIAILLDILEKTSLNNLQSAVDIQIAIEEINKMVAEHLIELDQILPNDKRINKLTIMTVDRYHTEIFSDRAEGTSDIKPITQDIQKLLRTESYVTEDIKIWFDDMQGFWRWSSTIEKV
ncbi:MAG TPA: hypothetical protein P5509_03285 [Bacteroidales bacterium]|nr:hypothetical protein [Bacteroidales bacterium]